MDLDESKKEGILGEDAIKPMARKCYRTIMIAYRDFTQREWDQLSEEHPEGGVEFAETIEHGLVLAGVFGLMDPLRPGISQAVAQCHRSGINVRMVTGDYLDTAVAISKEAGIVTEADLATNENGLVCMTGKQFQEIVGGLR